MKAVRMEDDDLCTHMYRVRAERQTSTPPKQRGHRPPPPSHFRFLPYHPDARSHLAKDVVHHFLRQFSSKHRPTSMECGFPWSPFSLGFLPSPPPSPARPLARPRIQPARP